MDQEFIGSYKILRQAGAGGMAKVYLAVHQDVPNLKVVLKILDDPRMADRFRQEADKLALLDGHPNICKIKHFFNHGEDIVIAMEFIEGMTLEEKIKADVQVAPDEAIRITCALLDILGFAHSKGVFHRDIKPGNIMIDTTGTVKVIDFGIAKSESDPNLTVAGTACGTPAYMSPEQFTPTPDINYALVDIYAAGTTLFVMLTGKSPFEGDNPFAIRDAKMFNEPPNPRDLNKAIPKALEAVVLKSIARIPEERYQSAQEMTAALGPPGAGATPASATQSESFDAERTIDTPRPVAASFSPKIKKTLFPFLIGIAGALIIAITMFAIFGGDGSDSPATEVTSNTAVTGDDSTSFVVSTGELDLSIAPTGDVWINEEFIGQALESVVMGCDTGTHIVRIENNKAVNKRLIDTFVVAPGEIVSRSYRFNMPVAPPKPKPAALYGTVVVGSTPKGADIFIDGKLQTQKTNFSFNKIESGKHTIRLVLSSKSADTTFMVRAGERHKVKMDLSQ